MLEFQQKVLPASVYASLPAPYNQGTYVWGYKLNSAGPQWPAVTIEARQNVATTVQWNNNLRQANGSPPVLAKYLTIDQTLHWADVFKTTHENGCMNGPPYADVCLQPYSGPIPTTVHLHGAEDYTTYDGHPDTWFTPGNQYVGAAFATNTYNYNNQQEATTLWFHDHALGITRLNVFSGLAGFYLLRDNRDTGLSHQPHSATRRCLRAGAHDSGPGSSTPTGSFCSRTTIRRPTRISILSGSRSSSATS